MTGGVIRVVLVDDHSVVRAGVAALLSAAPDVEVVAVAADAATGVAAVLEHRPDVILMDLSLPDRYGTQAIRDIVAVWPEAAVVALTAFADGENVQEALDSGAVGYLLKDIDPADLLAGVRSAAAGQSPLDPRVTRSALGLDPLPAGHGLTERERDVLRLLVQGLSNAVIATRLGITQHTVKAHLRNAYERIGVRDRTSAALWAAEHLGDR
jgi:DNA-binding NarL/FixJ family response regulator